MTAHTVPGSRRRASGQSLVEFALALPLFFMLILFILEGGRLMGVWISVSDAAREGARVAALPDATNAEVRQMVKNYLLPIAGPGIVNDGNTNATSDIDITCRSYTYDSVSGTWSWDAFAECTSRSSEQEVRVEVLYTYAPLPLFSGPLGLANPNWSTFALQAEARAYVE